MVRRGWAMSMGAAALALLGAAAPPSIDPIAAEQTRLIAAKNESAAANARAAAYRQAAASEADAAARARAEQAAVVADIEKSQADIAAAQARVTLVEAMLDDQRGALERQQAPVARLLAALQSFARRPAIVGLVEPGSVDDLVHVRAVLATVTPAIRERTAGLRGEVDRTRALRASAALARQSVIDSRAALDAQQLALTRLEAQHEQRASAFTHDALHQSDRAIAMGEAARDAVDRMQELGDAAQTGSALAALPGPVSRPLAPGEIATRLDLARWPSGDAPYTLPVAGTLVTGLGEISDAGVRSRGLTFATAPGAPVRAPAGGRIAFAAPFRDYGSIVIIDHGDGWTTLVTGLSQVVVHRGDPVAQGVAIGRAASGGAPRVTVELRRRGRPVDMIPLLG